MFNNKRKGITILGLLLIISIIMGYFSTVTSLGFSLNNLGINFIYLLIIALISINVVRVGKEYDKLIVKVKNTDSLTGLPSWERFSVMARSRLNKARPSEYELISLDIDFFRIIANYYGIKKSKEVIKVIAKTLKARQGSSKTIISRFFQDRFVILQKCGNGDTVKTLVEDCIIPSVKEILGISYNLSMSVGIYVIEDVGIPINTMIDYVEAARSQGKSSYKTTYTFFADKIKREFDIINKITFNMENALNDGEFKLMYQPKIDLTTGKIQGAEVLVRWVIEDGRMIYPDEFIPVLENNGFIARIDMYVFKEVCRFISTYGKEVNIPKIAVNLSVNTLKQKNLIEEIRKHLNLYSVSSSNIELEITESNVSDDPELLKYKTTQLKKMGFSVAMDDFGAGESSLNRLSVFDIDIVKLDKAFLHCNDKDNKGKIIIESIIKMCDLLGLVTLCEGVEELWQAQWLQSIGCDLAQGYYFSKPITMEEFLTLLKEGREYQL